MKSFRSTYFTPLLHLSIWLVLLAIPTVALWNQSWMGLTQLFFFLATIYHIGLFYFNAYFLYPKLLNKRTWWLYIICIVAIVQLSHYTKIYLLKLDPGFVLTDHNERVIFFSLFPILVASILFRLISDRIRFERLEKEARAQRLDAELKFLRSQVSPHFLFNMMTNMVSLARQKSELLEPSLIRLSELLRYMLYDSAEDKIAVADEVDNINNYVSLQQLRFGDQVLVDMQINPGMSTAYIEPMLLIPFIENAFKHGVSLVDFPIIRLRLNINNNLLEFSIENNFTRAETAKDKNSGIGLANVKNRLDLLYPEKYSLSVTDENKLFSVHLKLNLS